MIPVFDFYVQYYYTRKFTIKQISVVGYTFFFETMWSLRSKEGSGIAHYCFFMVGG